MENPDFVETPLKIGIRNESFWIFQFWVSQKHLTGLESAIVQFESGQPLEELINLLNSEKRIGIIFWAMYKMGYKMSNVRKATNHFDCTIQVPKSLEGQIIESIRSGEFKHQLQERINTLFEIVPEMYPSKQPMILESLTSTSCVKWTDNAGGVLIAVLDDDGKLHLNIPNLEQTLGAPFVRDSTVAFLAITGDARCGKSFLLNLFMQHLKKTENESSVDYRRDMVPQFLAWRGGYDPATKGIWITTKPFWIETTKNKKVALFLMDTQGLFDSKDDDTDMSKLFAFSSLLSSTLIYNVQSKLKTTDWKTFKELADYGKVFFKGDGKYQSLILLVRDWKYTNDYGFEEGKKYLNKTYFNEAAAKKHKSVAEDVASQFENMNCFMMPSPSDKVVNATKENDKRALKDVGEDFLNQTTSLETQLLQTIEPKQTSMGLVRGGEMIELAIRCCNRLNGENADSSKGKSFSPELFEQEKDQLLLHTVVSDCIRIYKEEYNKNITSKKNIDENCIMEFERKSYTVAIQRFDNSGLLMEGFVKQMKEVLEKRLENSKIEHETNLKRSKEQEINKSVSECLTRYKATMDELMTERYVEDLRSSHELLKEKLMIKVGVKSLANLETSEGFTTLERLIEEEYSQIYEPRNELHKVIYERSVDNETAAIIIAGILIIPIALIVILIAPFALIGGLVYGIGSGINKLVKKVKSGNS